MGVRYIGNCNFTLQRSEPRRGANTAPLIEQLWRGREDRRDAFLALNPLGKNTMGGYITATSANDHGPFSEVTLTIMTPPDFTAYVTKNGMAIKTATLTAEITGYIDADTGQPVFSDYNGAKLQCTREVMFYSPETRYEYFASSLPSGARFGSISGIRNTIIIRSTLRVSGPAFTGSSSLTNAGSLEVLYTGATAPALVVTALFMPEVDRVTSTEAPQIDGTPWYQCADVVSRELQGG